MSICASRKRILTGAVVMLHRREIRERSVGLISLAMLVLIIGRAGAFVRYHQRADGVLRRTLLAEQLALRGLQHALQNFAALRGFGVGDADAGNGENAL